MVHQSTKPGPDTVYFETGSQSNTADLIAAQDSARAQSTSPVKKWAPWVIGGLVLGGGLYLLFRE